jgi:phosphopantetheinyl transferase
VRNPFEWPAPHLKPREARVLLFSGLDEWARSLGETSLAVMGCLVPAELERAAGIVDPKTRLEFVAGRTVLRCLLAKLLRCRPDDPRLNLAVRGKPSLGAGAEIRFNLSHSAGFLAIAFSRSGEVGVDVEPVDRRLVDRNLMEKPLFRPEERAYIRAQPNADHAFVRLFTRKEAVLKAMGTGFSMDPLLIRVLTDQPSDKLLLRTFEHGNVVVSACVDVGDRLGEDLRLTVAGLPAGEAVQSSCRKSGESDCSAPLPTFVAPAWAR